MKGLKGILALIISIVTCGFVMVIGDKIAKWLISTSVVTSLLSINSIVAVIILFLISVFIYESAYYSGLAVHFLVSQSFVSIIVYQIAFVAWMVFSAWIALNKNLHPAIYIAMIIAAITALYQLVIATISNRSDKKELQETENV